MDIDDLIKEIEAAVKAEAKSIFGRRARAAARDSAVFLNRTRDDLARWTAMLADGRLNKAGYQSLVAGAGEVMEMHALKQKGVALAAVNEFRDRVLNIIIDKTFSMLD